MGLFQLLFGSSGSSRRRGGFRFGGPGNLTDNAGRFSIDMDGDTGVGIGGGMVLESDGELGRQIAPGLSMDLGPDDDKQV